MWPWPPDGMRTVVLCACAWLSLVSVMADTALPLQSVPDARALTRAVGQYVEGYQRDFIRLIADEHAIQEVHDGSRVIERRETRGELFSTFLDDEGVWMSVHEVTEVDRQPVPPSDGARALLTRQPFGAVARQLATANARYNIGPVTRNFNEPTLALLPFTPRHADGFAFERGRAESHDAGPLLVTLAFRARDGRAIVGSANGRRVSMRGTATIEVTTGRIRGTTLTISDGRATAVLDTAYALDDNVGLWVPADFRERYTASGSRETTTVRTTLSRYRRFDVTSRILP